MRFTAAPTVARVARPAPAPQEPLPFPTGFVSVIVECRPHAHVHRQTLSRMALIHAAHRSYIGSNRAHTRCARGASQPACPAWDRAASIRYPARTLQPKRAKPGHQSPLPAWPRDSPRCAEPGIPKRSAPESLACATRPAADARSPGRRRLQLQRIRNRRVHVSRAFHVLEALDESSRTLSARTPRPCRRNAASASAISGIELRQVRNVIAGRQHVVKLFIQLVLLAPPTRSAA